VSQKPTAKAAPKAVAPALHFAAHQDIVGEAQRARPAITRILLAWNTVITWTLAACTLIVGLRVVQSMMAPDRVWASMPDGTTYELVVYDDPQAAMLAERQAEAAVAQRVPAAAGAQQVQAIKGGQ
jgi:hypothetical protein